MANYTAVRTQLEHRRAELLHRVGAIEGDLRQAHEADWVEQATQLENDEVLEGLDVMSRAELRQIAESLRRIQEGTYGTCAKCGRDIASKRLEAMPMAITCVRCAG